VDIINPDKLCVNLFKGFDFTWGQNFQFFPQETDVAVITVLRYRAACDSLQYVKLNNSYGNTDYFDLR